MSSILGRYCPTIVQDENAWDWHGRHAILRGDDAILGVGGQDW
jgi:hypothetical protein